MHTVIEGKYQTKKALMADPASTTYDINAFGDNAEAAVGRCNVDKDKIKGVLKSVEPPK